MQGYNANFNVYEFIMHACYAQVDEVIALPIPHNALLKVIIDFVMQRKRRLEDALKCVALYFLFEEMNKDLFLFSFHSFLHIYYITLVKVQRAMNV